jgi:hypothetical protein
MQAKKIELQFLPQLKKDLSSTQQVFIEHLLCARHCEALGSPFCTEAVAELAGSSSRGAQELPSGQLQGSYVT